MNSQDSQSLSIRSALAIAGLVMACFHLAQSVPGCGWAALGASAGLCALAGRATARQAFYAGLGIGIGWFAPQTGFLWTIFGPAAVPLWLVLAWWPAFFVVLLRRCFVRWGALGTVVSAPVLWTGIEYFRCELYWLKFTWLSLGIPFESWPGFLRTWGVYGAGYFTMALGAVLWRVTVLARGAFRERGEWHWARVRPAVAWTVAGVGVCLIAGAGALARRGPLETTGGVRVAGVQLEFPGEPEVVAGLEKARRRHPDASLFVLSEYTFDESVPASVLAWCRKHGCWLIAGGREWLESSDEPGRPGVPGRALSGPVAGSQKRPFQNTAFVVSTNGEIVFRQVKSVPIQFFEDGLPATVRQVWDSPWGRIGIGVCYDLSYRRVMDDFVRLGAQALVIPAMDVEQWGRREHELNARMARVRSAEYGLEIFRVTSSGISQLTDSFGRERERAGFPGPEAVIGGTLRMAAAATTPLDAGLAPLAAVAAGLLAASMIVTRGKSRETAAAAASAGTSSAAVPNHTR